VRGRLHAVMALARGALERGAATPLVWLGTSLAAIAVTLTAEALAHQPHRIHLLGLVSMVSFSTRLALVLGAGLSLLHAIRLGIERYRAGTGLRASTWVAALLAIVPTWDVAAFLTSGEAIRKHAYVAELRGLLFALLLTSYPLVWHWHALGVARWLERKPALARLAWWALGLSFLASVFFVISDSRLQAYGDFARYLVPPALVVASTLPFALVRSRPRLRWAALAIGLVLAVGPTALDDRLLDRGRTALLARSVPARLLWQQLGRAKPVHPGLDLLAQRGAPCAPPRRPESTQPAPHAPPKNVLLIGIDAMRGDFVGRAIGSTAVTPNLTSWSRSALVFTRAITPQPRTKMALAALAYGMEPMATIAAPPSTPHLLGLMPRHTAHQLYVFPEYLRGVDPLDGPHTRFLDETDAATDALLQGLRAHGERGLFAWVHYIAPHLPHVDRLGLHLAPPPVGPYAAEVSEVDRSLARVFAELKARGLADQTLIVVYSDHGYSLGEGGYYGYWSHLHRPSVNVPLMVSGPGVTPGVSRSIATLIDIAPTVLERVGIELPETMSGISLLAQPRSPRTSYVAETHALAATIGPGVWQRLSLSELAAAHLRVSEQSGRFLPQLVAVDDRFQLKVSRITGSRELYALDDLHEEHELSLAHPDAVTRLLSVLARWNTSYAREAYCASRFGR
jgi:hypothetical protein